jgi:hypothetical protein
MPRGKKRKLVLARLGQDLSRIEKAMGHRERSSPDDTREPRPEHARPYHERKRSTVKGHRKPTRRSPRR